eukprot:1251440-Rhodomonas_salina.4
MRPSTSPSLCPLWPMPSASTAAASTTRVHAGVDSRHCSARRRADRMEMAAEVSTAKALASRKLVVPPPVRTARTRWVGRVAAEEEEDAYDEEDAQEEEEEDSETASAFSSSCSWPGPGRLRKARSETSVRCMSGESGPAGAA